MPRHVMIKMLKPKDKDKNHFAQAALKVGYIWKKDSNDWIDFSSETMETRKLKNKKEKKKTIKNSVSHENVL